jgi:hypothetical protein
MRIKRPEERWFQCVDDPDEGSVLIKHLSPGEIQDITDATMPQKIEYSPDEKGNMVPEFSITPDRKIERESIMTSAIKDWKNFFDENGNPIECTKENIIRASREIYGFNEFIAECRKILADDVANEMAGQEKN